MSDMNIKKAIDFLSKFPQDISVSVTILGSPTETKITSYKGLVVIDAGNEIGPAIFASNSTFIPSTNVASLIRMLSVNPNHLSYPVRLLAEQDGFFLNIHANNESNFYASINGDSRNFVAGEGDKIRFEASNKYEFKGLIDLGTFVTLIFKLKE